MVLCGRVVSGHHAIGWWCHILAQRTGCSGLGWGLSWFYEGDEVEQDAEGQGLGQAEEEVPESDNILMKLFLERIGHLC